MARFGKLPVEIKEGVTANVADGLVVIKGPKGELTINLPRTIKVQKTDDGLVVKMSKETKQNLSLQGTIRSHLLNAVHGVKEDWVKELEINGAGYRAEAKPTEITLVVGYSHPVNIPLPKGVKASVEKNIVKIEGPNKADVGHTAAKVREVRTPNPYTGSGIKYRDEVIRRKAGKQAAKAE